MVNVDYTEYKQQATIFYENMVVPTYHKDVGISCAMFLNQFRIRGTCRVVFSGAVPCVAD